MKFNTKLVEAMKTAIVDAVEELLSADAIQVEEIEDEVRALLQEVGAAAYGASLSAADAQRYGTQVECPQRGQGQRVSRREAKVLSVFGWVSYRRSYYRNSQGEYWSPLDEQAGLTPGRATPRMQSLLGIAGVSTSFEEARQQIARYLQVEVSANMIREVTQQIGAAVAAQEEQWRQESEDRALLQARQRTAERKKRVYGSVDGVFVPLEGEWREAKMISWYQVGIPPGHQEARAQEVRYHVSLERAEEVQALLWATGVQYGADVAEEVVFVADGAPWIWRMVSQHFPQAVQIVDWMHAMAYLHAVAQALPWEEERQEAWLKDVASWLWEGEVEAVLQEVGVWAAQVGEAAQQLLTYYTRNKERMRYGAFRAQGYWIGSGVVESACKQVVSTRLKRAGARWTYAGAAFTAKARAAWLSGSWDTVAGLPLAA